ncbi:MAG: AAA-like domain-containing protein [Cyanobacteriota bacterium]
MMPQPRHKDKRRRGVILTSQGFQKLQTAISKAEFFENSGNRYTLEDMSDRTGLAVNTLMKVWACEAGVDRKTLKSYFSAFNLTLEATDYFWVSPEIEKVEESDTTQLGQAIVLELPGGQVPLDSPFYVERPPIESECYKTILQPGALLRIKAPRRMGKTSLCTRILEQAASQGLRTVSLSFQLADREIFQDLEQFLRWFCANVSLGLQLPNQLGDYWDEVFGSIVSCKMYFEQYLLASIAEPLVLGLDDVDRLFAYPDLASDFFGLLRTWHEEAKNREIWRKLRLVVVHSTEIYISLFANKSPFNVGLPIELPPFTSEQVQDLRRGHGLDWSDEEAQQLTDFVGGNPYLVRVGLYHIAREDVNLKQVWQTSSTSGGSYSNHLQRQLWKLQQEPSLAAAFGSVVRSKAPVELDLVEAFKLQSMGLVHLVGEQATVSCQLYAQYFCDRF